MQLNRTDLQKRLYLLFHLRVCFRNAFGVFSLRQNAVQILIVKDHIVTDADQIVLINKDSVECAGTHSELLKESELDNSMWQAHISEGGEA